MSVDLLIAMLLFTAIGGGSMLIWWELYFTRNGRLRKLLMFYFFSNFWVVSVSGLYYFFVERGYDFPIRFGLVRIAALLPMAIAMAMLWRFIKYQNKNDG